MGDWVVSDAHGDPGLGELLVEAVEDLPGDAGVGADVQDRELVTTDPGDDVRGAEGSAEDLGDRPEQLITCKVTGLSFTALSPSTSMRRCNSRSVFEGLSPAWRAWRVIAGCGAQVVKLGGVVPYDGRPLDSRRLG